VPNNFVGLVRWLFAFHKAGHLLEDPEAAVQSIIDTIERDEVYTPFTARLQELDNEDITQMELIDPEGIKSTSYNMTKDYTYSPILTNVGIPGGTY